MAPADSTCWTVIRGAAAGQDEARETFARLYAPVVRAYLGHRWRDDRCRAEIDDATQEVFVECFRRGGILERADRERPGGFRAFLYGVVRNVAARVETRQGRRREHELPSRMDLAGVASDTSSLSRVFDRAWAESVLREAAVVQARRARGGDGGALRRVELLRLRFQEDLPIREIARRWEADPAAVHRDYRRAREEFRQALAEVVSFHHPGFRASVEGLLGLLG